MGRVVCVGLLPLQSLQKGHHPLRISRRGCLDEIQPKSGRTPRMGVAKEIRRNKKNGMKDKVPLPKREVTPSFFHWIYYQYPPFLFENGVQQHPYFFLGPKKLSPFRCIMWSGISAIHTSVSHANCSEKCLKVLKSRNAVT